MASSSSQKQEAVDIGSNHEMTRSGSLYVESAQKEEGSENYTVDNETKAPNLIGNKESLIRT